MKVFYAVLGALLTFAAICFVIYALYSNHQYGEKVDACINKLQAEFIMKSIYNVDEQTKIEMNKECREANQ